jgi:hypothetical protein
MDFLFSFRAALISPGQTEGSNLNLLEVLSTRIIGVLKKKEERKDFLPP